MPLVRLGVYRAEAGGGQASLACARHRGVPPDAVCGGAEGGGGEAAPLVVRSPEGGEEFELCCLVFVVEFLLYLFLSFAVRCFYRDVLLFLCFRLFALLCFL